MQLSSEFIISCVSDQCYIKELIDDIDLIIFECKELERYIDREDKRKKWIKDLKFEEISDKGDPEQPAYIVMMAVLAISKSNNGFSLGEIALRDFLSGKKQYNKGNEDAQKYFGVLRNNVSGLDEALINLLKKEILYYGWGLEPYGEPRLIHFNENGKEKWNALTLDEVKQLSHYLTTADRKIKGGFKGSPKPIF